MGWQHGYNAEAPYTCGFYRELAPSWLDFVALLQGQPTPRPREGAPFVYLELGSGMGLGLCLLAAAYPEGRFIGIDFKPDHILHSRRLATELQLSNVEFREGDFLSLVQNPADLVGACHYVTAHGIATWITEPIQRAMLNLAGQALLPGGLFYCSYNTLPGWLPAVPFQQLVMQLSNAGLAPVDAVHQATATLTSLLGTQESPSALALAFPGLKDRLAAIPKLDLSYLTQEYINEGWQPLSVNCLHERAAACKLQYVGSATLPENFEILLPEAVRATVMEQSDPGRRQVLLDLAINQSFRRDVFVRGRLAMTAAEQVTCLDGLSLRLCECPAQEEYMFATTFGSISGRSDLYQGCEKALAAGPCSLGEVRAQQGLDLPSTAQLVSMLLFTGRLGLDRGPAGEQALDAAKQVNRTLRTLQAKGRPYNFLVAPRVGSAVGFGLVGTLLLENPDPKQLTASVEALGQRLNGDPAELAAACRARIPWLEALGVL